MADAMASKCSSRLAASSQSYCETATRTTPSGTVPSSR